MPTKCTRPSSSAGSSSSGTGTLIDRTHRRRRQHHPGEPLVGVARDQAGGRARHRRQPRRVGDQRGHGGRDPLRGERGVVDQQPAAGVDDRAGVELLLAVADRQRHEHRGQPDRGDLGDGVRPGPADHQVGGGVGEVHPVEVRHHDVRRVARRAGRRSPTRAGARRRAAPGRRPRPAPAAAADTDWLSRRAPCEPPVTSSVGRSGSRPNAARAPRRAAPAGRGWRSSAGSAGRGTSRAAAGCRGSSSRRGG